ncbi:hypothetical protein PV05_03429 [Exophiala xenobiotica]|uniref:DUF7924 domain-containing protein n=1 Tax=Exophiala xenobiotica TaxID=348802 RepID=A0A0D2FFQ9_9EURO|nr:uncharacterized protein PV05_03429 [Exophiala xenobiotica]KIW58939.1 hypothetical protein PV05_03429 [Exophiala xenobiotica]
MPVDMAAGIAKRDTGGARESRHKRGQQQNNPDEDEDEDTTEPRRKSRRIQDSASQGRQQNPRVSSKTCRQSLRVQEKQATNQQRTARLFPTTDQLSEHNLRIFNGEINPAANNAPILERTSSSPSGSSEAETIPSQRSSDTNGHYRYTHLEDAEVYIHTDAPGDIQVAIDRIVKAEVSNDRRIKLRNIAKEFYDACKKLVQAGAGEADFVSLFRRALEAMNPDQILFCGKADWREELKPIPQQSDLDLSFLVDFNAIDTQPLPKKAQDPSLIKTPRPNISIGIKKTAVISALAALASQNVSNTKVKKFLQKLESTTVPSQQGGPAEPLLIAFPAQRASDLVFPFAVVEGKAYSTGKQVFEAQNQAAVAGASGLKIQLALNELVKRSTTSFGVPPSPFKDQLPLFFSICTEGPYHELWAHYTLIEDGVRTFNMRLLQICNGVLLEGVEEFMVSVDNVLRWGAGPFLESVVERLGTVAKKIGA